MTPLPVERGVVGENGHRVILEENRPRISREDVCSLPQATVVGLKASTSRPVDGRRWPAPLVSAN